MAIGIMQGRLLPPVGNAIQAFPGERWEEEFALAARAGLECIEWIYDRLGEDVNPLNSPEGIERMAELAARTGVVVKSVCADWFMDYPLVGSTGPERLERVRRLDWLLGRCNRAGITRMVLPFVDSSSMRTGQDRDQAAGILSELLPIAGDLGVEIHLETDLGPREFGEFLSQLDHPFLKVNYDTGNSASLGFKPLEEFQTYGPRVGSVHIKDRRLGGSTMALGTGDTDFRAVFSCLAGSSYSGDFILQVARGEPGQEVSWARQNLEFVRSSKRY